MDLHWDPGSWTRDSSIHNSLDKPVLDNIGIASDRGGWSTWSNSVGLARLDSRDVWPVVRRVGIMVTLQSGVGIRRTEPILAIFALRCDMITAIRPIHTFRTWLCFSYQALLCSPVREVLAVASVLRKVCRSTRAIL